MSVRIFGTAAFALLLFTGCQQQRLRESYIVDAFGAETRLLEDKIYELNDRIDDLEKRIASSSTGRRSSEGRFGPSRDLEEPGSIPRGREPEIPDLTPPTVDPGTPATPQEAVPPTRSGPRGGAASGKPPSGRGAAFQYPSDTRIERIALDPATRTVDLDDTPGDDGLWVVVLPENRQGELVPEAGRVTIVLLDSVARTHVGQWDFDAITAREAISTQNAPRGLVFRVKWDEPPRHPNVHLFVRYETPDGRRLETNRPLTANIGNHVADRWTPRSAEPSGVSDGEPRTARQHSVTSPSESGPPADVYR